MELFSKEIEELRKIQEQNSKTLRDLHSELEHLTKELTAEEQHLKSILESKERHHAHFCEQMVASYKLKLAEANLRKSIAGDLDRIVYLQRRVDELEIAQKENNHAFEQERQRIHSFKTQIYAWYATNHPALFKRN